MVLGKKESLIRTTLVQVTFQWMVTEGVNTKDDWLFFL